MRNLMPKIGMLAAVAALALVVGCGGEDDSSTTAAGTSGNGNTEQQSGILRIGTVDAITSFNPFTALSLQTGTALSMVYPQLLQTTYDANDGFSTAPDFAKTWSVSPDGKTVTFDVYEGAKWSDGQPMTAEDAAWSLDTIVRYGDGPTGQVSYLLEGMTRAEAPDPTTVVAYYDSPRAAALIAMAQGIPVLPKHIWQQYATGNGRGLRTYRPDAEEGGLVSGGPYLLKQYERRGTTVYVPNPEFYGPPSHAEAVALSFYTNEDAMVEDFTRGELDMVESIPTAALNAVESDPNATLVEFTTGLQADLFFNSNPRKPKNRELLDPRVREALMSCIDRDQIIDVIFQGHARKVETLPGTPGGDDVNTDLPEREYDCAAGNEILDEMGYERGSDGVRTVPATSGEYAQAAHPMSYELVTVAGGGEYNVDRTAEIVRAGLSDLGVKVVQKVAGDETATNTYLNGADCDPQTSKGYTSWDLDLAYSVAEITALDTLSGELKESWCAWNFTGFDDPQFDRLWAQAAKQLDDDKRRQILFEMQQLYYDAGATFPLAEKEGLAAQSKQWSDFMPPELAIGSKLYYTSPRQAES